MLPEHIKKADLNLLIGIPTCGSAMAVGMGRLCGRGRHCGECGGTQQRADSNPHEVATALLVNAFRLESTHSSLVTARIWSRNQRWAGSAVSRRCQIISYLNPFTSCGASIRRTPAFFAYSRANRFGRVRIMWVCATERAATAKNGMTSPTRRFCARALRGRSTGVCSPESTLTTICGKVRYWSSESRRVRIG